jgi:hypothetical protein
MINHMATITKSLHYPKSFLTIPITLEQIAHGLRGLSKDDFETLEIIADREAMKIIPESVRQASKGKMRKISLS